MIDMQALDKLDRHILRSLQQDGRATYDQSPRPWAYLRARCCGA
jgi:DNA-binding Lrp family transcriptional regulator